MRKCGIVLLALAAMLKPNAKPAIIYNVARNSLTTVLRTSGSEALGASCK
jgi:hypothetical protein